MNQRISILGCGWLGMALALELQEKSYSVYGSTTSVTKISKLESIGVKPFLIDIGNKDIDISEFLFSDVLVIAITSKNIDDFKNLIRKIEQSNVRNVLFISSTSVYPNTNALVTEKIDTNNTPLANIERLFITNSVFKTTIIRFGGLFGYNRKPGNFIKVDKTLENPEGYINFIHRDDCIQIIEQIIVKNTWGEILNACADSHPKRRYFYLQEVEKLGRTILHFNEKSANNYKLVSSQKLKNLLNYEFKYADLMNYS